MLSDNIGALLQRARKQSRLSRDELARRGGVSTRLVAELERCQRPNVSLESALRLLQAVGVSVIVVAPDSERTEIGGALSASAARAARAQHRRETWTGRQIALNDEGDAPAPPRSAAQRLAAVAEVSTQAYAIAAAKRGKSRPVRRSR
jgi:transcriptional regulator with XRE-family HTH domain